MTKDARRAENEADDTERAKMSVSAEAIIASIRCKRLRREICLLGKIIYLKERVDVEKHKTYHQNRAVHTREMKRAVDAGNQQPGTLSCRSACARIAAVVCESKLLTPDAWKALLSILL